MDVSPAVMSSASHPAGLRPASVAAQRLMTSKPRGLNPLYEVPLTEISLAHEHSCPAAESAPR